MFIFAGIDIFRIDVEGLVALELPLPVADPKMKVKASGAIDGVEDRHLGTNRFSI